MRGPYTVRVNCAGRGCQKTSFYEARTRREETELRKRLAKKPWLCVRHTNPDEVLSAENLLLTRTLVVGESERHDNLEGMLFWCRDGRAGSSFVYGDGFRAFAKDFPKGTKLVVTAQIVLPEED